MIEYNTSKEGALMRGFRRVINFRDLGGYKTKDGRITKKGLVFRSASPGFMSEKEFERFEDMNFHTILDLRSEEEIKVHPYPDMKGTKKLQKSGVVSKSGQSIDFSPNGMRKTGKAGKTQLNKLRGYYKEIVFGNKSFKVMFKELLEGNVPFLFHCATGKDRTGLAAILFLLALGVDERIVRKDYLLSNEYRKKVLENTLKDIDKEKDPELYELMTMFDGVSENIFDIVMDSIYEKYDSLEEFFLKEYGLNKTKLKELRDKYTEEA